MQLYEENKNTKGDKVNKILKISIITTIVFIIVLIALIMFLSTQIKNTPVATIDGKNQNAIYNYIKIEQDENENQKVWVSIKEIAPYFGYKAFNGNYNSATEDKNKCYVIIENSEEDKKSINEVANFELDSNVISKLDLTTQNAEYELCTIDEKVVQKDEKLYTTIDGIEKAFNVIFDYNKETKEIKIFTLPTLVDSYKTAIEEGKYPGYKSLDTESATNQKAILDGFLIVTSDSGKYGALNIESKTAVLEAKYDGIRYMPLSSSFMVSTNKKIGIISKEGKTLISPKYDSLKLIDSKNNYYLAKMNNLYGVIDGNGKEIIYIENEQIGINVTEFEKNEIKSGYIILDKLIPVMKNKKWAFYDIKGNQVSDFKYDSIGSTSISGNNIYGLLIIPEYNLIVVGKDKNYSLMDLSGKDNILPFSFDGMYIKVENGSLKYCMEANSKEYNITKTLSSMGIKTNE